MHENISNYHSPCRTHVFIVKIYEIYVIFLQSELLTDKPQAIFLRADSNT